jgi:hypothetical protein
MSWQDQTYRTLSDGRPHRRGDLFDAVSTQIPLHHATRFVARQRRDEKLLPNFEARWRFFNFNLARMGVETDGSVRIRKWADQIRLRPLADRSCETCDGPVIKIGWSSNIGVRCLACEAAAADIQIPQDLHGLPAADKSESVRNNTDSRRWGTPITHAVGTFPASEPTPEPEPTLAPAPASEVVTVTVTPRWLYQRRRSFLEFLRMIRLPGFSVSKLDKLLSTPRYRNNPNALLMAHGKLPIQTHEFNSWAGEYLRRHPP